MPPIKNIFIFHQKGLEVLAPYVAQAIGEVMDCFPAYKSMFPIQNMGNWASDHAYYTRDGHTYLTPYESIQWYLERAKARAEMEGRWPAREQINVSQIMDDLEQDPYFEKIPQWGIYLTSHDLYGGGANNFCLGCTKPDSFSVISTRRFLDRRGQLDIQGFQTIVQHEFGHILRLTEGNRPNTHYYLGEHCTDPNCIMQQRPTGDFSDITARRLALRDRGIPPICPDCITQGRKTLFQLYANHERLFGPNNPNAPTGPGGR